MSDVIFNPSLLNWSSLILTVGLIYIYIKKANMNIRYINNMYICIYIYPCKCTYIFIMHHKVYIYIIFSYVGSVFGPVTVPENKSLQKSGCTVSNGNRLPAIPFVGALLVLGRGTS